MVGTPLDVLPYVRGIQMVLSGYEGYTKGKRRDADLAIREEIKRCGTRARNHIMNVHDSCFREKKIDISKKTIGILGLALKEETNDTRD